MGALPCYGASLIQNVTQTEFEMALQEGDAMSKGISTEISSYVQGKRRLGWAKVGDDLGMANLYFIP